ncbi:helix-turn-helix transcriptional regulator (plasmid) [Aneurinibacillus sp. Ricciae_BoGa-3]|uniref:helix-turn-helix domain-containing protein n=1 Tax=Aneurinibacillus sp. Ricciae_BoGa-3 TaxID=3022697 RepID=UPI00233FE2D4|nr:helix-turn-helix transcriptional regulator [Aneurinibacillus sp. Ricciae_BoGa-3]WCK57048.1 helix-turn-helix transcriptional regulator [Aneurinibacillus sp. Ricciae_BoGa-3]
MIQSNLRILMAHSGIKTLRELGRRANVSWKIISNLDNNEDIDTIQLRNLLKICLALNCTLDQLISIDYKSIHSDL